MFRYCLVAFFVFCHLWISSYGFKQNFQLNNDRSYDSLVKRHPRTLFDTKDLSSARNFVEWVISSYKVVLFSKSYCKYSRRAKDVLSRYNLPPNDYQTVELDQRTDGQDILSYLGQKTGSKTVPRLFINGRFIGGSEEIINYEKTGELRNMLISAGVIS